jgi:hypothetical protein
MGIKERAPLLKKNPVSFNTQLLLWRLVGILTITTTVFFALLTGVTETSADPTFFIAALFALTISPAAMLVCLRMDLPRLAAYSSIPGILVSAGTFCFMLFAFFDPHTGIAEVLLYPLGVGFALPYGYAGVLQLKVAVTICLDQQKQRSALETGEGDFLLAP